MKKRKGASPRYRRPHPISREHLPHPQPGLINLIRRSLAYWLIISHGSKQIRFFPAPDQASPPSMTVNFLGGIKEAVHVNDEIAHMRVVDGSRRGASPSGI